MRRLSPAERERDLNAIMAKLSPSGRAAVARLAPAERERDLNAIMAKLSPSERAAVERLAARRKTAPRRADPLGERLARLPGKERMRALWTHYQTEFRAELADPRKWEQLPQPCQRAIAEAKAEAVGGSSLNERERRALAFNEGVRIGFTPNARLAARR